jgi:hypothetical protein
VFTTTGTDSRVLIVILVALTAAAVARWYGTAARAWSFAVYYLGYRVLSVQLSCGTLAVSGVPIVVKYAAG